MSGTLRIDRCLGQILSFGVIAQAIALCDILIAMEFVALRCVAACCAASVVSLGDKDLAHSMCKSVTDEALSCHLCQTLTLHVLGWRSETFSDIL